MDANTPCLLALVSGLGKVREWRQEHALVSWFFFSFFFSSIHCKLESLGKRDTLLGIYSHSTGLRDSFRLMMGVEGTNPTAGGATPGQV